jgi:hypothetical protein
VACTTLPYSSTLSHLLTYLLTPWSRVLLEKLTGSAASQEIPRIFGTRGFITVPTSARHLSLSWANSIQSSQTPQTCKLYYNITKGIFPVHVRKVTKLSLCFTKGKLIIALDEPTEAIRLFGWQPEKKACNQSTYVTKLFQLNYTWHFSRNPGIDFNVSSDKEREREREKKRKRNAYINS